MSTDQNEAGSFHARRPWRCLALVALHLAVPLAAADAVAAQGAVAFVGVTVVPMDHDGERRDATVIVRDGRIVAVGPRKRTAIPAHARRIDGRGKWLMPGLVDAHIHLTEDDSVNRQLVQIGLAKG